MAKMKIIAETYGWTRLGQPCAATLIQTLSSNSCDRQVKHILENRASVVEKTRFDPYYREKSEFATIRILEHIKSALSMNGLDAAIRTEEQSNVGRHDIVIALGSPLESYSGWKVRVRIEVKAGLGINLEQISRYLWDPSPLILVRVMTRHVTKIEPSTLQPYLLFMLRELHEKCDRILSGKLYTIRGNACFACTDDRCPHNRGHDARSPGLVTLQNVDFGEDLASFFRNLSYVSEKTASTVVEELSWIQVSRGTGAPASLPTKC
jgi:hypothetical protein